MELGLDNKVAIVTGAAQGIGEAAACELSRWGTKVVLADINLEKTKELEKKIKSAGGEVLAVEVDVSSGQEVFQMVQSVIERFHRVDILVNNVGINFKREDGRKMKIIEISEEIWDKILSVDLKSVFICSKAVLKYMLDQHSGKIVNIASLSGQTGDSGTGNAAYAAAKAGVICFTKSLAREAGPCGINVNCISPGRIEWDPPRSSPPEIDEVTLKETSLGRFGTPQEIADAVVFLVSDKSRFIHGTTLDVNGGRGMR